MVVAFNLILLAVGVFELGKYAFLWETVRPFKTDIFLGKSLGALEEMKIKRESVDYLMEFGVLDQTKGHEKKIIAQQKASSDITKFFNELCVEPMTNNLLNESYLNVLNVIKMFKKSSKKANGTLSY